MSVQQGWECPKCGAVYAPWITSCLKDHSYPSTTTTDPNIFTPYIYPQPGTAAPFTPYVYPTTTWSSDDCG